MKTTHQSDLDTETVPCQFTDASSAASRNVQKNMEKNSETYCKPSGIRQVDATNLAFTKIMDKPINGSVNIMNALIVSHIE
jgi:hypothetical protein